MLRIKNITTILFVLALLSITSCNKINKDNYFESYFPLAIGNTWIYNESYFYPDTVQTPNSVRQLKVEIIKDTLIDNNQLAYVVIHSIDNSSNRYLWYVADNELRERYVNSSVYYVLYKLEMENGSEWTLMPDVTNQKYNSRKVINLFPKYEFLKTVALAYKLQHGNPNLNQEGEYGELVEDIFAPNIGLLESNYKINYYGPSRTHRILTDYYTN